MLELLIKMGGAPASWRSLFDDMRPWLELPEEHWQALRRVHRSGIPQVQVAEEERVTYLYKHGDAPVTPKRSGR